MGEWRVVVEASRRPRRRLARAQRKAPTSAEKVMWSILRGRRFEGFKFRRQAPMGRFVADFVCLERCLIVELDGPFHDPREDLLRDDWLLSQGYRVLRFSNEEVQFNLGVVLTKLRGALRQPLPRPATHGESSAPPHPTP